MRRDSDELYNLTSNNSRKFEADGFNVSVYRSVNNYD